MRLGAGGDLAAHAGQRSGELVVGVVPEIASGGVQADIASGLGVLESRREQAGEGGAVEGVVVPALGHRRWRRHATMRMRLRYPLASSIVVVWRRSSSWVMWPISAIWALVARAGAVRVRIASGRPSQPERSVGDRVEISRADAFRTLANSAR